MGQDVPIEAEYSYNTYHNRDRLIQIIDNDAKTCEELSVTFRIEGFQTAFAFDAGTFFASGNPKRPDVFLLNLRNQEKSAINVLHRIKEMRTGAPVFMLTDEVSQDEAVEAMKAGATDVITKPLNHENVVSMVRTALKRDVLFGTVQGGRRPIEIRGFNHLTPREREVLQLISNGQSNKETGRELGISPRTVEVHRARVMDKLGARNTADLMRIVLTS